MKSWRMRVVTGGLFLAAAISTVKGDVTAQNRVGALEYVEGSAFVDNQAVAANHEKLPALNEGGSLTTAKGHAEMLLTPGVFLRMDAQSEVRLVSGSLTDTLVRLDRGSAIVEVNDLHKDNLIRIQVGDQTVQLLKTGLYRFQAEPAMVEVLNGKVAVTKGDRTVKAGKNRAVMASDLMVTKFRPDPNDELSRWSRLRSEYEADASVASAQYVYDMGIPWGYSSWMWNPWFDTWTWLPASGYWLNPYGFGYWGPSLVYGYYPSRYYGGVHHYAFAPRPGRIGPSGLNLQRGPAAQAARSGIVAQSRPGFGGGTAGRGMSRPSMGTRSFGTRSMGGMRSMGGGFRGGRR
ncbi:FecR family protein [uncultured Paludibaculum sp.]|uniref:FecR family protein n=1 Tax=uncultured Paludibaculum sp. TaxID=1765020 RepID=UPI002AAAFE72|nr:FecR family protein [uncultured Paludibaculum sp.]